jgi:hypothetical protein
LVEGSGERPIFRLVPVERSGVRYLVSDESSRRNRGLFIGWGRWSIGGAHVWERIGGEMSRIERGAIGIQKRKGMERAAEL